MKSDLRKLTSLLLDFKFDVRPESEPNCYRMERFQCTQAMGWTCRLVTPEKTMIVSAGVDYVLCKVLEREYPINVTNLNFALAKVGMPALTVTKEFTWAEKASMFLKDAAYDLPNAKIEMIASGKNFIMSRICSKKQAKKIIKSRVMRDASMYMVDRRGRQIVIAEVQA